MKYFNWLLPILWFQISAFFTLSAQQPCPSFGVILQNIESTFDEKAYDESLKHIKLARACAPEHEKEIDIWNYTAIHGPILAV